MEEFYLHLNSQKLSSAQMSGNCISNERLVKNKEIKNKKRVQVDNFKYYKLSDYLIQANTSHLILGTQI